MSNDKKVLLHITNLKQYFPLKKKGLYVKANDGITIDIYEGETLGLVGESGCGKSTLGRTILQFYPQTDGRTMYHGRTIDELAPAYVKKTLNALPKYKKRYLELEEKRRQLQSEYDAMDEKTQYAHKDKLDAATKAANDAFLNVANLIGGFLAEDDLGEVSKAFLKEYHISLRLRNALEERREYELDLADANYALETANKENWNPAREEKRCKKAEAKLDACRRSIESIDKALDEARAEIETMRGKYKDDAEFQRIEKYKDGGIDLTRLKYDEMRRLRSELQLIFQDPYSSLNPRMSVGQIIGEGMIAHKYFKKNDGRMQQEILRIMDECGLAPYFIHRFPHQFSGGQRQRIGIARSLAVRPKFVVCDEAVSALDVSIQSQIINLLQDLKEHGDLTYLFITHDLSVVKYISDRIAVMYLGTIVELAASQEIFDRPLHPYTEALLNAIPTTDKKRKLEILEGDIPSPINPPKGCKFHTRCKYCTEICEHVTPEWREVSPNHFVACHHSLEK